jgi:hypothetical protein
MPMAHFSKVSPAIHDSAAKKEGFGLWTTSFIQQNYSKKANSLEEKLRTEIIRQKVDSKAEYSTNNFTCRQNVYW